MEFSPLLDSIKIHGKWITIDNLKRLKDWPTKKMFNDAVNIIQWYINWCYKYNIKEDIELKEHKFVLKELLK